MISKEVDSKSSDNSDNEITEEPEKLPKKVYVIAQEVKIVKALASNDPKQRAKQLRKLRKWLSIRSNSSFPFSEDDFLRIWKGLYYCMWMSDKPLVQEELAEDLGKLTECFSDTSSTVAFFGAFLSTMCAEWFGIDQWRMDKFLMLVRRMLRYTLRSIKKDNWTKKHITEFNSFVYSTLTKNAIGLSMHLMDVFFEELAKVSEGEITANTVTFFIKPFIKFMAQQKEYKLLAHMRKLVFDHLMYQSELGREYSEKYNAWKEMGFPTASIDDLEKAEDGEEEDGASDTEEAADKKQSAGQLLDPRAGNIDVFMPILPVDAKRIITDIERILYKEETNTKSRKFLKVILENYKTFDSGKFPLGIKKMPTIESGEYRPLVEEKIAELDTLEDKLFSTTRKLKQLNKRQRKRLLASVDFENADEENLDDLIEKSLPQALEEAARKRKKTSSGDWLEEEVEVPKKKKKAVREKVVPNIFQEKKTKPKKGKKKIALATNGVEENEEKPTTEENGVKPVKSKKAKKSAASEWEKPLEDGEIEYFIPAKKIQLMKANEELTDLVVNPFAKKESSSTASPKTPKNKLLGKSIKSQSVKANKLSAGLQTPTSSAKRVKIMLQRNTSQKPAEYIKQVRSSPQVPFDADKKPTKGLLKANSMPSPINPFYKKKIGLKLLNDTL